MSVYVNIVTLGGVALASDGRCLLKDPGKSIDKNKGSDCSEIKILRDDLPKIYTLGGRYGLSYAGISRLPYGKWDFRRDMIPAIKKMLIVEKPTMPDVAANINEMLREMLIKGCPEEKKWFNFSLCGYENQDKCPVLIHYADGELTGRMGYFHDNDSFLGGIFCAGYADHIAELARVDVAQMSITEAINHAESLVRHEMKFQERCGGQIYLAIVTRNQCGAIGRLPTGEIYFKEEDVG